MRSFFNRQEQDNDLSKIVDTQLSTHINKKCDEYMQKHILTSQKLATLNFKAMPEGTNIREFLGPPRADHQQVIDHIEKTCNGGLQKVKGQSHISKAGEDERDIDRKIEMLDVKLTPLKGKFNEKGKQFKGEVRIWFWFMIPVLFSIAGIELVANYDVFNSLGGNATSSIATAILAMFIAFFYAHFVPDKIREYAPHSPKKRLALFILSILPIGLLYFEFSRRRIDYLLGMNPDLQGVISDSPWVFTIINCLAYVISCWIIWAYKPGKEKILAYKKYRNDKREIDFLEKEREGLCKQKANLPSQLRGKLTKHYNVLLLGKQHEEEVVTRYHRCFEEMKMELYMRTNGACAPLFTGDINKDLPPLKLNFTQEEIQKPLPSAMSQFMGVLLMLLTLVSCTKDKVPSLALTVMADYTDTHIPVPEIEVIKPLITPLADKDGSCDFRFTSITHTSVNPSYEASLKPKPNFGNSLEHVSKKKSFFKQIEGFLLTRKDTLKTYPNSSILTPVLRELVLLKQNTADKKVLLLYSDLQEASHILNVYSKQLERQLHKSPDMVVKKLIKELNLPKDLEGIQLHIVYYPKDTRDDLLFKQMLHVWKLLLSSSGIEIHLGIAKPIKVSIVQSNKIESS